MHVFQTYKTRTNPETGKRVHITDKKGRKIPHARYRFEYRDYRGVRRLATGTTSEVETRKLAHRVQAQHYEIRRGFRPAPKSAEKHASRPIGEVNAEYIAWGRSQGGRGGRPWGKDHARKREDHLAWWREQMGLESLADLEGGLPRAEAALRGKQEAGSAGKTLQNYREALCAFCAWCVERGYLIEDPLSALKGFDTTPEEERRSLTPDEIERFMDKCRPRWRLLYETAFCTGLRANELRSLMAEHLDPGHCGIHLEAAWTKNRRPDFQRIPAALMEKLLVVAAGKGEGESLLEVPRNPVEVLERDLKLANIQKHAPGGKLDFHALRTTYINLVIESGASLKEAQDMARHRSPELTMNVYGRSRRDRCSELAEKVGEVVFAPSATITEPQRKAVGAESPGGATTCMVRGGGVEPPRPKAPAPKAGASARSAILARR